MAEITIKISKDGSKTEIEGENFTDGSCGTWETKLAQALGSLESSQKKPEYYNQNHIHNNS